MRHALALLMATIPLGSAPAHAQVGCDTLRAITEAGAQGFRSWRGRYDRTLEEYRSTYVLPGASGCSISTLLEESTGFECEWTFTSFDMAKPKQDQLVAEIRTCLRDNRVQETVYNRPTSRGQPTHGITFELGYLQPEFEVLRQEFRRGASTFLKVMVPSREEERGEP